MNSPAARKETSLGFVSLVGRRRTGQDWRPYAPPTGGRSVGGHGPGLSCPVTPGPRRARVEYFFTEGCPCKGAGAVFLTRGASVSPVGPLGMSRARGTHEPMGSL